MGDRRLVAFGGVLIVTGIVLALTDVRLVPFLISSISEVFWDQPTMPENIVPYHRFVHGVVGGVIAGWGAMLLVTAMGDARVAWRGLAVGTATWFIVDTSMSLWHGAWPNAVLNALSLAGIIAVLVWTRPGSPAVDGPGSPALDGPLGPGR